VEESVTQIITLVVVQLVVYQVFIVVGIMKLDLDNVVVLVNIVAHITRVSVVFLLFVQVNNVNY